MLIDNDQSVPTWHLDVTKLGTVQRDHVNKYSSNGHLRMFCWRSAVETFAQALSAINYVRPGKPLERRGTFTETLRIASRTPDARQGDATSKLMPTFQRCSVCLIHDFARAFGPAFNRNGSFALNENASNLATWQLSPKRTSVMGTSLNSPPRLLPPAPPADIRRRAQSTGSAAGSDRPRSSAAACARRSADNGCRADAAIPRPP